MKHILREKIEEFLPGSQVEITSEDDHHFFAVIVSAHFIGQSLIQRQRQIYSVLNEFIVSGKVHALSMQTYTPEEWADIKHK